MIFLLAKHFLFKRLPSKCFIQASAECAFGKLPILDWTVS